ncbi:DUF58 domain-containing protein [Brevifollis gellanilyticus]|uniref:DUF58 domain-containing protein n=1 Tax=Brevifollis gellanilyticus TaxID=748831 RepID=A0A512M7C2_9BACT|nr:DUF58 domain-containing protein [Brevifollis gellanilyticus]GEP42636.1 hypothetical protein BGE01nite_19270 [Brevifollis gellanilyticus]
MNRAKPETEDERLTRILKRVRKIELITRGIVKETLGGAYHSRFKGQGIEFDDFREYQPGDDVRFLDWNVTARMNEPFVRKYIEERELTVMLVVDVSGSGDYGSGEDSKRERAAEVAAVFAFSAVQNQDKVGLILVSDQIEHYLPAQKGSSHALRCLRDILNLTPKSRRTNLTPALDLAMERIPHRALVLVVSDFLTQDQAWEHSLRSVAAKHDVVAAQITDPHEWELPKAGRVCLQDPETGEQYVVNTSNPAVRRLYAERVGERQESLSRTLRKYGVEKLHVRLDEDYVPALKSYFRSRKRRKR